MLDKVQSDRLAKLEQVKALGIDPYGRRYDTAVPVADIVRDFEAWEKEHPKDPSNPTPIESLSRSDVAGRLVLIRDMGKMIFAHIRDESGQMQIALRKNALDENTWKLAKLLDLGDIVAAAGPIDRTKTGEVTIWADGLTLLCKSLSPMPEKWHGLSDVETRYRQRYLDLMANPDSLAVFKKRIAIIQNFRDLLKARGFVEVETPMMQAIYGGAAARPFTTHHNALDVDLFMRISPELYLKRLLVGGMGKVYEINRNFRNEGIDTKHNPEFTMMELYQAYADYEVMMEITEELVADSAKTCIDEGFLETAYLAIQNELIAYYAQRAELKETHEQLKEILAKERPTLSDELRAIWDQIERRAAWSTDTLRAMAKHATARCIACHDALLARNTGRQCFAYGDRVIDFTRPWLRRTYDDLLKEFAGVSMRDIEAVRAKAKSLGLEPSNKDDAVVVNEVFELTVEPGLAKMDRPVFVMDYPAAICPLTRRKSDDPTIALRFECFIAGMELANAYTELNDPAVQEANFRQQLRGEAEGETMRVMDEDFVTALLHGMPPAGGLGIGIDRAVMLLTNTQSIRDVILFPLLRPQ